MTESIERLRKKLDHHGAALRRVWRGSDDGAPLYANERSLVTKALLSLQRGLTGPRSLPGSGYMQSSDALGAYLLYYWPVSYTQMGCVLWTVRERLEQICTLRREQGKAVSVLDAGCGPAPAAAALCDTIEVQNGGQGVQIHVHLTDSSRKALSAARRIFSQEFPAVAVSCTERDLRQGLAEEKGTAYDVILVSHAINELYLDSPDAVERRAAVLAEFAGHLSPCGLLVVCEPALLRTSRELSAVRNALLSKDIGTEADTGRHRLALISPCLSGNLCPVVREERRTCHAEVPWNPPESVSSLAEGAGLDRQSVKMSFAVFSFADESVPKTGDSASGSGAVTMRGKSVSKTGDGVPEAGTVTMDGKTEPESGATVPIAAVTACVVSDAMLNKGGRVRYLLCDGTRRFALSAKAGDAHAGEQQFFTLRRYDVVIIENPQSRENGALGVAEGTKLTVLRRFG